MMRTFFLFLFATVSFPFYGQETKGLCFHGNKAFDDGEFVSYTVSYNWGPVWVDAGKVTFSVKSETYNGKTALHLKSTGKTYASYDFLFKVRDYYDSWIDPETFETLEFRRMIYEGGWQTVNTMRFSPDRKQVFSTTKNNNNPVRYDTLRPGPCAFDMVSAVYFTRTLDFSTLTMETKIPVQVVIDDAVYSIYIKALKKEVVQAQDGKRYRCVKFSAKMVEGTIFKGDEDVQVWVTDDENKIPVYIEAKILVGTVKAYLDNYKGLKNPVSSRVH